MLTEFTQDEFDELSFRKPNNDPMHVFVEQVIGEFAESGMEIAEVTGWPGGDPKDYKEAGKCSALLRNKAHGRFAVNQRRNRIFIRKEVTQ